MKPMPMCAARGMITALLCSLIGVGSVARAQSAHLDVGTRNGTDTCYYGIPLEIDFRLDAGELSNVLFVSIPLELWFSNGNIIGPLAEADQFVFSAAAHDAFESLHLEYGEATDPDTILIRVYDFNGTGWVGAADFGRLTVTPSDTGRITFTDVVLPPVVTGPFRLEVVSEDSTGGCCLVVPIAWDAPTIVVEPCPSDRMGDVNADLVITAADIVYLANYTFKGGPAPLPVALAGDADCNRRITSADMIRLAAYIFRSGAPPCPCSNAGL